MKRLIACVAALMCASPASAAEFQRLGAGPIDKVWVAEVFGNPEPRVCGAYADMREREGNRRSRITIMAPNWADFVRFTLTSQQWTTTPKQAYRVGLVFDDDKPLVVDGQGAATGSGIALDFHRTSKFASKLRHSLTVGITVDHKWIGRFPLLGSNNALNVVLKCRDMLAPGAAKSVVEPEPVECVPNAEKREVCS